MTNGEFTKQVQPIITGQGYGCGNCNQCNVHWDSESGAGYGTGSGRIDGTYWGGGWGWDDVSFDPVTAMH